MIKKLLMLLMLSLSISAADRCEVFEVEAKEEKNTVSVYCYTFNKELKVFRVKKTQNAAKKLSSLKAPVFISEIDGALEFTEAMIRPEN